jgi:hypothetical protein
MVLDAVKHVFINRIESINYTASLANVWPIEDVGGALKPKLLGPEYSNTKKSKSNIKKRNETDLVFFFMSTNDG